MTLSFGVAVAILGASLATLGLMTVLLRRLPLTNRSVGGWITTVALAFVTGLTLTIFVIMAETLAVILTRKG